MEDLSVHFDEFLDPAGLLVVTSVLICHRPSIVRLYEKLLTYGLATTQPEHMKGAGMAQ